MPDLLVDLETEKADAPLYHRIADSIRTDILAGRLRRGERVPSTRTLATELHVNRNTVAQAYEQLISEGFLDGRHGSGTYVARELPHAQFSGLAPKPALKALRRVAFANSPTPPEHYRRMMNPDGPQPAPGIDLELRLGAPDLSAFPLRQWRRTVSNQLLVARRDRMFNGCSYGLPELRKAIAGYLVRARGIDCTYRNVLITSGSQQGLWLASSLLVAPGERVMMEDPGYLGARAVFQSLHAQVQPVAVDSEGIDSGAVAQLAAQEPAPKLLYLTPSHQYPTGGTLSAARRMELLELSARHGFMIVEDDYDSEFRYEGRPVRALAGIDTAGVVCYLGTFSKVMYPSLRVGYVVAPEWLVDAMVGLRWHMDFQPPTLESAALAEFIEEGHFERHLRRMRALYAEKREAFVNEMERQLPGTVVRPLPAGGMKLALQVPRGLTRQDAIRRAQAVGVKVYDPSHSYSDPSRCPQQVLAGFTSLSAAQMQEAARRLAQGWKG
ncbi:MAG: PLP-dependent aminotransferase family protein [Planctomycetes bacterium]|nr:PLP-dependent aminotransferase family protein [Planctomycetota bacterium]